MIIVLKQDAPKEKIHEFCTELEGMGLQINDSKGSDTHILGLIGDTKAIAESWVLANPVVETCRRVSEPYKKANRKFHPEDTVVQVGNTQIGGGNLTLMAGPCSVESEEQVVAIAKAVKASGATMLRGGAFKPRTSPYSFQGLGATGLEYLKVARQETGLPIVTELMDLSQLPLFKDVDVIQIGARNMQNFDLLKAVGHQDKPVMIKRGMSATYEEWLMSAEYVMAGGNENVILCERGIRTFETYTRNTLDLAAVPMQDFGIPLLSGLLPILTLLALSLLLSQLSLRSLRLRALICGTPTVLIRGGKLQQDAMRKNRFTIDELMEELREQGVTRIEDVKYAVLENSGQLTVFPWTAQQPPTAEQLGLGLEDRLTSKVGLLSGGQRQALTLLMATLQRPKLLLLDEPTTYLDVRYQIQILQLVRRLNEEYGLTIVMVLHDINQALYYSDEILAMKEGKMIGQGVPEEILTEELLEEIYGVRLPVFTVEKKPFILAV